MKLPIVFLATTVLIGCSDTQPSAPVDQEARGEPEKETTTVPTRNAGPVAITQMLIGSVLDDQQQIVTPQDSFTTTEKAFHAHAFLENVQEATNVHGAWWFGRGDMKIFETSVTVTPELPVAKFALQTQTDWPPGTYRFVVSHEGKALDEVDITVAD